MHVLLKRWQLYACYMQRASERSLASTGVFVEGGGRRGLVNLNVLETMHALVTLMKT